MINSYENNFFNKNVYVVDVINKTIEKTILRDLCDEHAEVTTSPIGIAPTFHLRGNELWTWGVQGNHPELIERFETPDEAEGALYSVYLYELTVKDECPIYFDTLEEAEADLAEFLLELEE